MKEVGPGFKLKNSSPEESGFILKGTAVNAEEPRDFELGPQQSQEFSAKDRFLDIKFDRPGENKYLHFSSETDFVILKSQRNDKGIFHSIQGKPETDVEAGVKE